METKHTPGPWVIEDSVKGWDDNVAIKSEDGEYIGLVSWLNDEQKPNAHLIAAAPDLLEALQKCQTVLEWVVEQAGGPQCEHEGGVVCFCQENAAISTARAAIAKATGA